MKQRTLAILKPDTVARHNCGAVIGRLEQEGFEIKGARTLRLSKEQAEAFYAVHHERPFFRPLVAFMTSGPCLPLALERDDAVAKLREVIGATDPREAAPGTVRALYAESKERNAIHASDSPENALREVGFFFSDLDMG